MKVLKSVSIKNYVLFKSAELDLDYKGLTVIRGKNLDSNSKLSAAQDTNAVGKSLLFSAIPQLVFASNPLTQAIRAKAKKDVFGDSTRITLQVEGGGNLYEFGKYSKGNSFAYSIKKDGQDVKARTQKYPEQKIAEFFDKTEDEFYSLDYLSSSRPSTLQYGSASQRLQFFTNLFKLDSHDEMRKLFNGLLRESRDAGVALNEVRNQLDDLQAGDVYKLEKHLNKAQEKAEHYAALYERLQEQELTAAFLQDFGPTMTEWEAALSTLNITADNPYKIHKLLSKSHRYLDQAEKQEKQLARFQGYKLAKQHYLDTKAKLANKLELAKPTGQEPSDFEQALSDAKDSLGSIAHKLSDLSKAKRNLKQELDALSFDKDIYNSLKAKLGGNDKDALTKKKHTLSAQLANLRETLDSLETLIGCSSCPTCQQSLDKKQHNKLLASLQEQLAKNKEQLEHTNKILRAHNKLDALTREKDTFNTVSASLATVKAERSKLELRYEKASEAVIGLNKWASYFKLKQQLDDLAPPTKPQVPEDLLSKQHVQAWQTINRLCKIVEANWDRYTSATKTKTLPIDKIHEEKTQARSKSLHYNQLLPDLTAKIEIAKQHSQASLKLEARKLELESKAQDREILELLTEAYGNKGIKLLLIKQIAAILEKNANKYAPLLFPEPVSFQFNLVSHTEFSITASIQRKDKTDTADIRTLSGAESRAFSFLLPLAILPLIPLERRLNLMVLDEPTTNMSDNRKDLFINSFLPKLASIVPHVVVITTGDETEHYPKSRSFTVVKEKGKATLVKGDT